MARQRNDHDRIIASLPPDRRKAILSALRVGTDVLVEESWDRKLDSEFRRVYAGEVIGVADNVAGGHVLIIQRAKPDGQLVAIPATRVLRVSMATVWYDEQERKTYFRTGEVLAGPPREAS